MAIVLQLVLQVTLREELKAQLESLRLAMGQKEQALVARRQEKDELAVELEGSITRVNHLEKQLDATARGAKHASSSGGVAC